MIELPTHLHDDSDSEREKSKKLEDLVHPGTRFFEIIVDAAKVREFGRVPSYQVHAVVKVDGDRGCVWV